MLVGVHSGRRCWPVSGCSTLGRNLSASIFPFSNGCAALRCPGGNPYALGDGDAHGVTQQKEIRAIPEFLFYFVSTVTLYSVFFPVGRALFP